jgi:hypothetical protein
MFVCHAVEFVAKAKDGCIHLLTEALILLFKLNNMHVFIAYLLSVDYAHHHLLYNYESFRDFLKYTCISHI